MLAAAGCLVSKERMCHNPQHADPHASTVWTWLHRLAEAGGEAWPQELSSEALEVSRALLQAAAAETSGRGEPGLILSAVTTGSLDLAAAVLEAFPEGPRHWEYGTLDLSPLELAARELSAALRRLPAPHRVGTLAATKLKTRRTKRRRGGASEQKHGPPLTKCFLAGHCKQITHQDDLSLCSCRAAAGRSATPALSSPSVRLQRPCWPPAALPSALRSRAARAAAAGQRAAARSCYAHVAPSLGRRAAQVSRHLGCQQLCLLLGGRKKVLHPAAPES